EALDDSQVAGICATSEVIRYEYHVLYSSSYQVPVLYFRACFLDGRPLTLDEIWEGVHECYRARLLEGPWDTITQQNERVYQLCNIATSCKLDVAEAVLDMNPLHCDINREAINVMMDVPRQFNVALEKIEAITIGGAPVMTEKINGAVTGDVQTTKYLLAAGAGARLAAYS
ncbi:Ubiquitin-like-conjugating enzyme ATG10, partial [Chelonia mydas]